MAILSFSRPNSAENIIEKLNKEFKDKIENVRNMKVLQVLGTTVVRHNGEDTEMLEEDQ